jgi:hypothetical protein
MTAEEWRFIPGFPGYAVSSIGRLVSLKPGKEGLKSPVVDPRGYLRHSLSVAGVETRRRVHQLVALAFIGPVPEGHEVRHRDGNGLNNVPENLAYGTSSENQLDKVRHGTHNMARKTQCKRGHEFTPDNTALITLSSGSIARRCRACTAAAARARRTQVA